MADDLSEPLVRAALGGRFGEQFRFFEEIGSTNDDAMDWATGGAPEGSLVVADHQTGGRGRWGRAWFSAPGKLLQFSLILRPRLAPAHNGLITAGLGVAVVAALRACSGLEVKVKWPNDAVIDGRKVAGMLVESTMTGSDIDVAICGIGINVHLGRDEIPPELRDRATSLAIEMGGVGPQRAELLGAIVSEIESRYRAMTTDPSSLIEEATELSDVLGRDVVVRAADGATITGRAQGFGPDGALRMLVGGRVRSVSAGEIEQLRAT